MCAVVVSNQANAAPAPSASISDLDEAFRTGITLDTLRGEADVAILRSETADISFGADGKILRHPANTVNRLIEDFRSSLPDGAEVDEAKLIEHVTDSLGHKRGNNTDRIDALSLMAQSGSLDWRVAGPIGFGAGSPSFKITGKFVDGELSGTTVELTVKKDGEVDIRATERGELGFLGKRPLTKSVRSLYEKLSDGTGSRTRSVSLRRAPAGLSEALAALKAAANDQGAMKVAKNRRVGLTPSVRNRRHKLKNKEAPRATRRGARR